MKKLLLTFILCLAWAVMAQAQSKEEKEVAEAVRALRQAMLAGDRMGLEKITSSSLTYGHSTGKIEDQAAYVEALASGRSDFKTMDIREQTVNIAKDVALVRHKFTAELTENGQTNLVSLGVLLVWHKEQGEWKLLARQAYKL